MILGFPFGTVATVQDEDVVIDTCGSYAVSSGKVDTIVQLYRRVQGTPSLAIVDMADFFLVASNDDQLSNQCPAAGSPSPMDSSLDILLLMANTQYIIAVVCMCVWASDWGVDE